MTKTKEPLASDIDAYAVACPRCKAAKGDHCVTADGNFALAHRPRRRAAYTRQPDATIRANELNQQTHLAFRLNDPTSHKRPDSVQVLVKMHPDMKAYLDERAERRFTSVPGFIKQLILQEMTENPIR